MKMPILSACYTLCYLIAIHSNMQLVNACERDQKEEETLPEEGTLLRTRWLRAPLPSHRDTPAGGTEQDQKIISAKTSSLAAPGNTAEADQKSTDIIEHIPRHPSLGLPATDAPPYDKNWEAWPSRETDITWWNNTESDVQEILAANNLKSVILTTRPVYISACEPIVEKVPYLQYHLTTPQGVRITLRALQSGVKGIRTERNSSNDQSINLAETEEWWKRARHVYKHLRTLITCPYQHFSQYNSAEQVQIRTILKEGGIQSIVTERQDHESYPIEEPLEVFDYHNIWNIYLRTFPQNKHVKLTVHTNPCCQHLHGGSLNNCSPQGWRVNKNKKRLLPRSDVYPLMRTLRTINQRLVTEVS